MKDFSKQQKILIWSTGILCFISLIPFLIIAFYNHPSADDYICTVPAMKWNPITMTLGWYYSWSSRYTSAFILSINPLVYRWLFGYQLNTWVLFFLLGIGFFLWFKVISNISNSYLWVITIMAVGVYVGSVPSIVEAFYYFGGAICYQPSNALLLILLSWWFYKIPMEKMNEISLAGILTLFGQGFILFLIAGNNEMAMMFSLAITSSLWLYIHLTKRKLHLGMTLLLTASIFSSCLIVFSPATLFRMEASSSLKRSYSEVMTNSISGYFEYVGIWLSNPCFIFFLILLLWLPISGKVKVIEKQYLFLMTAISILLSIFCFIPSYLGEGLVQGRTANALIFIFLLLYMINIVFWKKYLLVNNIFKILINNKILLFLFIITSISLFFTPNYLQSFKDLSSGDAREFDKERTQRANYVENALTDSVWVAPIKHHPKTIFFGDIGIYPEPWYDNFYAQYHGKKFISLIKH